MAADAPVESFFSPYAPLNPEGPLPPGLDERVVANAYKATRVLPKRVLVELGIRRYTETAAVRLRKALDNPAARARLSSPASRVKPLHQAIYSLLRSQPAYRAVYKRLVEPSEVEVRQESGEKVWELDPAEFTARVTADQLDSSWSASEVTAQSDEEALVLFALAYALLQPEDAQKILAPVLGIGESFREFFAATTNLISEQATKSLEEIPLSSAQVGGTLTTVLQPEGGPREDNSTHVDRDGDVSGPSEQTAVAYLGLRTQSVRKAFLTLGTRRSERQSLGAAHSLNESAFKAARDLELAAQASVRTLERDLRDRWEATTRQYSTLAQEYGVSLSLGACPAGLEQVADSLDHLESDGAELLSMVSALKARNVTAHELGAPLPRAAPKQSEPVNLAGAITSLKEQLAATAELLARAQQWRDIRSQLQDQLRDCAGVSSATSLATIGFESVTALLEHALVDPEWEALQPLLFRLWSERFGWTNPGAAAIAMVLEQALGSAASNGDLDRHTELLSYLPREALQDLLGLANPVLARHVVLSTFRESLARRHNFFLTAIWGFERAWLTRSETVGDQLHRLFSALYQFYIRSQSAHLAVSLLARQDETAQNGATGEFEQARVQDANDVAVELEEAGRLPGLFGRLRFWSMNHHFRPVASAVREQRRSDVIKFLDRLERQFRNGELLNQAVGAVGDRNIRGDHRESLTRYLDDRISLVRSWLSRTAPEQGAEHDARLGDQSVELQQLATQLARGGTSDGDISPGSITWLESEIGQIIARLRNGDILVPSPVWLGEAGPMEPTGAALRPVPTQLRSWTAYGKRNLQWRDLLQDQISERLLGVQRTLLQAVGELRDSGELDAAIEAAKTAKQEDHEVHRALEALQQLKAWRDNCTADIEALYVRLDALAQGADVEQRRLTEGITSELLKGLEDVEALHRDEAEAGLASCRARVEQIEREMSASAGQRRALEQWLATAGITPPHGTSIARLESLIAEARDTAAPRRAHLLRLQALDNTATPTPLREAVRAVVLEEDRPDHWPSADKASDAELYVDNFAEVSKSWWSALEHVDRSDVTFRRITALAELFADALHSEVRALNAGHPEAARLLSVLTERAKWSIPEAFNRLIAAHIETSAGESTQQPLASAPVEDDDSEEPSPEPTPPVEEPSFVSSWLDRLRTSDFDTAEDGRSVERTFDSFRAGRYGDVLREAPSAWRRVSGQEMARDLDALVAVYAWAYTRSAVEVADREYIEALALIFRAWRRLLERTPSLDTSLADWIPAVMSGTASSEVLPGALTTLILRMADNPPGSAERERFGLLLRLSDAPVVAQHIWDHFRGSSEQAKARTALLLLLFDLADTPALHRLFAQTGDQQKYLIAFTALAKRASAGPSTKLVGAITQSLRRLSQLKERPFRDYAHTIAARLRYATGRVAADVPSQLDREPHASGSFRLPVTLIPDESDPPIQLSVTLIPSVDYTLSTGPERIEITTEGVLLDPRTVEFLIRPKNKVTGCMLAVAINGESASGQLIDHIHRSDIVFGRDQSFQSISDEDFLDIYAGYDAKPVTGAAFVGREEELAALEQTLARPDPGAILLYGVRRLGKTSLLDELRRRRCVTYRAGSRTLFISVPVDQLSVAGSAKPFLDQFLQHIRHSVQWEDKNERFRNILHNHGVSVRAISEAGRQEEGLDEAPFLMKLRVYIRSLISLCPSSMETDSVVLVFDEFDKLLEEYRSGMAADVEDLTSQLRHAATEEHGLGIILAGSDLMGKIVGHYRNALFGSARVVHLECFDAEAHIKEATRIISPERLGNRRTFTADGIRQVIDICGGHPLYMRLLACAAAKLAKTRRIGGGSVKAVVPPLLTNAVFPGFFPDVSGTVRQQLQFLNLMEPASRNLSELFLLTLARYSSLERPHVASSVLERDDRLLNLKQLGTWLTVRNELRELKVIQQEERGWRFRFPILGELLRRSFDYDFDRLESVVASSPVRTQ